MKSSPRAFVIGHPIGHSRSPLIHGFWLKELGLAGAYEKIDVAPEALPAFVRGMAEAGFAGGNITVPHKAAAMALVDEVDEAGRAVGAVNTLWLDGGRLMAANTDVLGFLGSLDAEAPGWDREPGRAVVLGAGGAARAVVYGLLGRGFAVDVVNRSLDKAEGLAAAFGTQVRPSTTADLERRLAWADLLINTTSLGMHGMPPLDIDLASLKPEALVCDIVYVPLETDLLRLARGAGHPTVGGLGMLLHQAVPGFKHWFGVTPRVTPELRAIVEADIRPKLGGRFK